MYLLDFSLNNLSLMALTIATGFVVDDAIVVLEHITRLRDRGMPLRQAVLQGSRDIGFTVVAISVSLVAVFIPILFMGGVLGRLFHEFAITLAEDWRGCGLAIWRSSRQITAMIRPGLAPTIHANGCRFSPSGRRAAQGSGRAR